MYSQPTSTQPRTHMPHPNTIHKPMNIMHRTAQPAKASGQMLPTNTAGQQWKQKWHRTAHTRTVYDHKRVYSRCHRFGLNTDF